MSDCCNDFEFVCQQNSFDMSGGIRGADGTTFYPHVSAEGVLSWTNDGGKPNPAPVNIKGADGTPGKSAYAAAQEAGFTGTEAEFNAYLSGIGDLTQEVADQKSAIDDLTALVDRKAGALVDTASGAIASFTPDSTIPDLLGVTVAVEPVQAGSGDPSPDNVRPISGWNSVVIGNSASNLIDASAVANGFLQPADGVVYDNQNWNATPFIPARVGDYTLSWESAVTTYQGTICAYDKDQHYITGVNWSGGAYSHTFTLPFGTSYLRASWSVVVSGNPAARNNIRLNFGSADLGYTPFVSGNTYAITLGQTVYGCKLTIAEDGSVTALVDRAAQNVSAFMQEYGNAGSSGWRRFRFNTTASIPFVDHAHAIGSICDKCPEMTANALADIVSGGTITSPAFSAVSTTQMCVAVPATTLADANTYLTSIGGLQFVYPLANPITIQLDPVTISTISGQTNNVWADAGDVTVEFAADIKAYIDSKIAAAVAALS